MAQIRAGVKLREVTKALAEHGFRPEVKGEITHFVHAETGEKLRAPNGELAIAPHAKPLDDTGATRIKKALKAYLARTKT